MQAHKARGIQYFELGSVEPNYHAEAFVEFVQEARLPLGEMNDLLLFIGARYDEYGGE